VKSSLRSGEIALAGGEIRLTAGCDRGLSFSAVPTAHPPIHFKEGNYVNKKTILRDISAYIQDICVQVLHGSAAAGYAFAREIC